VQLDIGNISNCDFHNAFSKIMGVTPTNQNQHHHLLQATRLDSPLGPMLAIADNKGLYLLEFIEYRGLDREIELLRLRLKAAIVPGMTEPLRLIDHEMKAYFQGSLKSFNPDISH